MFLSTSAPDAAWTQRFHAGDRRVLEQCYRDFFDRALAAARQILPPVDAETVTHEIFYRLLSDEAARRAFSGGNFGAWIGTVTKNLAIDHHRRRRREVEAPSAPVDDGADGAMEDEIEARLLVERFRRERLPPKWSGVFELRFLRQLPQREAAQALGLRRSTLAYQEEQIRALLARFVLAEEGS